MSLNLANLDVEFLLDKSGSMGTKDCANGKKTRWEYGKETLEALANAAQKHDPDGIVVTVFARNFRTYEGVKSGGDKITAIYKENEPMGGTDTAKALKSRLDAYFARKSTGEAKSLVLFVMTDGAPDDEKSVADVIIEASKKLDRDDEVAISFVQVGKDDDATRFLKSLDDELTSKGAKFDIVDTLPVDEVENLSVQELIEKTFAD